MKKKFIFVLIVLVLTSCGKGTYNQSSYVSSQSYIGMSIQDFKKIAGKKAKVESIENGMTVFRMNDYDTWTGAITDTKFFYFDRDGKLSKINGGVLRGTRQSIDLNIKSN